MSSNPLPSSVVERIVQILAPEQVWLFGSRARETHGPDSDWDFLAVLPDSATDDEVDLVRLWPELRDLRRMRVEVIPMRRRDFDERKRTLREIAEAANREILARA